MDRDLSGRTKKTREEVPWHSFHFEGARTHIHGSKRGSDTAHAAIRLTFVDSMLAASRADSQMPCGVSFDALSGNEIGGFGTRTLTTNTHAGCIPTHSVLQNHQTKRKPQRERQRDKKGTGKTGKFIDQIICLGARPKRWTELADGELEFISWPCVGLWGEEICPGQVILRYGIRWGEWNIGRAIIPCTYNSIN